MRVAFFTEGNWTGTVDRSNRNMRTDLAWQCVMGAQHIPLLTALESCAGRREQEFDLGIVILPKNHIEEYFKYGIISLRDSGLCKKLTVMQEGPNWYWQDWTLEVQVAYMHLMQQIDFVLCHNTKDQWYYSGLLRRDDVHIMPTLLLEDAVPPTTKERRLIRDGKDGVMIGGNLVSWYNGIDSYSVATVFDTQIFSPSMGRMQPSEGLIEDITYLPYMTWSDWMDELSKVKYAVHLIRSGLAGSFALNCAYLGIPCIGYEITNTQDICHPYTTVPLMNIPAAIEIAKELRDDPDFYLECSGLAMTRWHDYYREDMYVNEFLNLLKSLVE